MVNKGCIGILGVAVMDRDWFIFNILIFMLLWVYGGDYWYRRRHSMVENDNKEVIYIVIFLGQCCPSGKGAMRLTLCEAITCETRPEHNTGNYMP